MSKFLNIHKDDAIVTLTMNEPQTRNALTGNNAADEFEKACHEISKDQRVKTVIITGAGPVFSAGGNLKNMKEMLDADLSSDAIRESYRNGIQRIPLALYNLKSRRLPQLMGRR